MTPKEAAIQQRLTHHLRHLSTANDVLKYLTFEKLTPPGSARCAQVSNTLTYVQGALELLTADLEEGRFPFRDYQVLGPERMGRWEG